MLFFGYFCFLNIFHVILAEEKLELRITRLRELSRANPVIRFNHEMFETFAKSKGRNYSLVLMLTALRPQRQCQVCGEAAEEFKVVATSLAYSRRDSDVFFGIVDYDEASEVFMQLNINSAPSILHIQPNKEISPSDFMDVGTMGYSAETIAKWVGRRTSVSIRVVRPPSYTATILIVLFMTVGAASLWLRQVNIDYLYNPSLWCMLSLTVIMCGITGQVYNQIRGPPLFHGTPSGEIHAFIYPGSDYQFVAETFIVMALYILATAGILMIHRVGETTESGKKKVFLFGGVGLFSLAFSLVLSVFRRKYPGYPYSFFFK